MPALEREMMQLDMGSVWRSVWIWRGALPKARYAPHRLLTHRLAATTKDAMAGRAAIEFSAIYGPRRHYGLLGAEFVPNETRELTIEVATSSGYIGDSEQGEEWILPGARPWTGEYVGLPKEHGKAVLEAARDAQGVAQLGSGTLRFDRAAYHHVDSNDNTYAQLAKIIVRLLLTPAQAMTEAELVDLVREAMRRQ